MLDSLKSLLEEQIKDLYNAENQLLKALPKMAKKASSDSLKTAFEDHLEETRTHVERLTQVAQILEMKPTGKTCKAMQGLIEEGKEVLEEDGQESVIDAALIAAAQRVEHYEISAYGTACAMAEHLGEKKIIKLLQQTLEEEKGADVKLSEISVGEILPATDEADLAEANDSSRAKRSSR